MKDSRLAHHFDLVKSNSLFKEYYEGIEDYSKAPLLEKQNLAQVLDDNFDVSKEATGVYLVRSGGTSQKPLVFPVDIQENLDQRQQLAEALSEQGIITPRTIALNLFSYRSMYRSAAILDNIIERCNATTLAVGVKTPNDLVYTISNQFKANMVLGTPSILTLFARYLQKEGKSLHIDNLLYAGEFLFPSQQRIFEEVFNTKHIYAVYGSAETGIWGWADYHKDPSAYMYLRDMVIEIDSPNEDGYGTIAATNLFRKRFPMFRYNMGDIGKLGDIDGIPHLILQSREFKSFGIYSNSYFVYEFRELLKDIDSFQIQVHWNTPTQPLVSFLLVQATYPPPGPESRINDLSDGIRDIIGYSPDLVDIKVEFVTENEYYINPATGKTPQVIDFRD